MPNLLSANVIVWSLSCGQYCVASFPLKLVELHGGPRSCLMVLVAVFIIDRNVQCKCRQQHCVMKAIFFVNSINGTGQLSYMTSTAYSLFHSFSFCHFFYCPPSDLCHSSVRVQYHLDVKNWCWNPGCL